MKSYADLPVKKEVFFCRHTGGVPLRQWNPFVYTFHFFYLLS